MWITISDGRLKLVKNSGVKCTVADGHAVFFKLGGMEMCPEVPHTENLH